MPAERRCVIVSLAWNGEEVAVSRLLPGVGKRLVRFVVEAVRERDRERERRKH